jgi:hypothetical protein
VGQLVGWGSEIRDLNRRLKFEPSDQFPVSSVFQNFGAVASWLLRWSLVHLFGWILTGMALMLGAPFWFDQLKKLVNIRSSGTALPAGKDLEKK